MTKEAYYFSHDANARNDQKILAMRSVYGAEGYGWYWIIVEMLREATDYKIKLTKYTSNALAMQMQCTPDAAHKFVQDCIHEFNLFESDGEYFWSNSLLRRMKEKEVKSEKARQAAFSRWGRNSNADAMRTQCERNAIKEKKIKENKKKDSTKDIGSPKIKYAEFVSLTEEEHAKLVERLGEEKTARAIEILDNYKGAKGRSYKSDYRAILSWVVDKLIEEKPGATASPNTYTHQRTDLTELQQAIAKKTMRGIDP